MKYYSYLKENAEILAEEATDEGYQITANLSQKDRGYLENYIVD